MTQREFLQWLKPRIDAGFATGLPREAVAAIRQQLDGMLAEGALQPFASRLHNLVRQDAALEAAIVAEVAKELRAELAPQRERTVVMSAVSDDNEE